MFTLQKKFKINYEDQLLINQILLKDKIERKKEQNKATQVNYGQPPNAQLES